MLLLDEPLAALDKKLREETQFELMDLQARLGTTFVIVTHDQEEAMTVAHRIAVMDHGRLVQVATPPELYEQPASRWVAEFIGDVNLIEGAVVAADASGLAIEDAGGRRYRVRAAGDVEGRAESVRSRCGPRSCGSRRQSRKAAPRTALAGRVRDIGYLGDVSVYKVRLDDGAMMKASVANASRLVERPIGWDDAVLALWAPDAGVVLTRVRARHGRAQDRMWRASGRASSCGRPISWLLVFFLVPFLIVLKISLSQTAIAQPPYVPVLDLAAGWDGIRRFLAGLGARQLRDPALRRSLRAVLSQEPADRGGLDRDPAR